MIAALWPQARLIPNYRQPQALPPRRDVCDIWQHPTARSKGFQIKCAWVPSEPTRLSTWYLTKQPFMTPMSFSSSHPSLSWGNRHSVLGACRPQSHAALQATKIEKGEQLPTCPSWFGDRSSHKTCKKHRVSGNLLFIILFELACPQLGSLPTELPLISCPTSWNKGQRNYDAWFTPSRNRTWSPQWGVSPRQHLHRRTAVSKSTKPRQSQLGDQPRVALLLRVFTSFVTWRDQF